MFPLTINRGIEWRNSTPRFNSLSARHTKYLISHFLESESNSQPVAFIYAPAPGLVSVILIPRGGIEPTTVTVTLCNNDIINYIFD